jgi:preprotein translocase subunit SecD
VTLVFQPQFSDPTPDLSSAAVIDATVGALRNRAQSYGLGVPEISVGADNALTITVKDIDEATAAQLFGEQALLEFKRPTLSVEGIVACKTAAGDLFGVAPDNVNPDTASRSPARCFSRDKTGDPVWEPAIVDGEELTAQSVQANGWRAQDDALVATFTPAGSTTLESLTGDLAGYPLGIFIGRQLIAAPRINRAITNGEAVISGFGAEAARMRAAQLNGGALPVPMTRVSASPTDS